MRKLLLLLTLAIVALVVVYRQRLYLRDPLATVYRGDAVDKGARAYINYSNDVLVENEGYRYVVQNWDKSAGVPAAMICEWHMACLMDADHASLASVAGNEVAMSGKSVSFVDEAGVKMKVDLR